MKFVDITNDVAFRKIFGNENRKNALISFLNAVIKLPNNNKIVDVKIENPYQLPNLSNGKSTIVDVKATDQLGNNFIIEMQVAEANFFEKRILYYTSQSYVGQIVKGEDYQKLNPAYFIGILEFTISKNPHYISCHKVVDVETGEHIIRDIEFNFIELPKFNKEIADVTTDIDQWIYFIKNAEYLDVVPANVNDIGLKEAYLEADKHNWTKAELADFERASIKAGDEVAILELAVKRAEIIAEERGEKRGEKKQNLLLAKRMVNEGIDIEIISKITGLDAEEIKLL